MLDRILTFLFRGKTGMVVLLGTICISAFSMTGCFSWSMLSCIFGNLGCDACADCFAACDDTFSCNTGCDVIDCMFGNGCTEECGNGGTLTCGGCNSTLFTDCGFDCSGCGNSCIVDFGNCNYTGRGKVTHTYNFNARYQVVDQNGNVLGSGETGQQRFVLSEEEGGAPKSVTWSPYELERMYYGTLYKVLDNGGNEIEIVDGKIKFDTSNWANNDYYYDVYGLKIILSENRYGEQVEINVSYDGVEHEKEKYYTTVGGALPEIAVKIIPGYKFEGFYYYRSVQNSTPELRSFNASNKIFHLYDYGMDSYSALKLNVVAKYKKEEVKIIAVKQLDGVDSKKDISFSSIGYGTTVDKVISQLEKTYDWETAAKGTKFVGWNVYDANGTLVSGDPSSMVITAQMKIVAVHRSVIKVTLHNYTKPNEGTQTLEAMWGDIIGTDLMLPTSLPENGRYSFSHWCSDSELKNEVKLGDKVTKSIDFYASWFEDVDYAVTYYNDIDKYNKKINIGVVMYNYYEDLTLYDEKMVVAPNGYTFVGWRIISKDGKTSDIVTTLKKETYSQPIDLCAVYTRKVSLVVKPGEGTLNGTTEFNAYYKEPLKLPVPTSSVAGKEFAGWSYNSSDPNATITDSQGNITSFDLMISDNSKSTDLVATWNVKQYTVSFVYEDNEGNTVTAATRVVEHGATVTNAPADPMSVPDGYSFLGWYNGNTRFSTTTAITGNTTYTAKYQANTYTIILQNYDGSVFKSVSIKFGEKIKLDVLPTGSDKLFRGWKCLDGTEFTDSQGNMLSGYNFTEDITLEPRYI